MKTISIFVLIFFSIAGYSQANLGLGIAIHPETPAFGLQVRGAYSMTERFAISGAYSHLFKENYNFSIDFDNQFKLFEISNFRVSPFAGINIREVNDKVNTGLQLGFFIEIPKNSYHIYFEPKAILDENSLLTLAAGFYF